MLTVFSTPKPFIGHDAVIQGNAIRSWLLLHRDVEVVLFGDEPGTAEICAELGLIHKPHVERNADGMKYVRYLFARANEVSSRAFLCFANCDMILPGELADALGVAAQAFDEFLMVGRRWDVRIDTLLDFDASWGMRIREVVRRSGRRGGPNALDYFVFPKGMFRQLPPFLVGRYYWDNWVVWDAAFRGNPVIDASAVVTAVHQDHGREYHPSAKTSDEALQGYRRENDYNRRLLVSVLQREGVLRTAPRSVEDFIWLRLNIGVYCASHVLGRRGIRRLRPAARRALLWRQRAEYLALRGFGLALQKTRRIRHALGLRRGAWIWAARSGRDSPSRSPDVSG